MITRTASQLLVADETGSARVEIEQTDTVSLSAGDIVALELVRRGDRLAVRSADVLTPYRGNHPFPSPLGEYYRVNGALAGMDSHVTRAHTLRLRAAALAAVRSFLDARGYIEVQTPHRVRLPGLEPHLIPEPAGDRYLITSPEYHMKRLLAGGLERIYSLGACWRGDETGDHHLHEFTMLEWYQAYASLESLMDETEALVRHVAQAIRGSETLTFQGRPLQLNKAFRRIAFAAAFEQYADLSLAGVTNPDVLRGLAEEAGYGPFDPRDGFEAIVSRVLVERVEPAFARMDTPVILYDFPEPLSALAKLKASDANVAERFELYAGGLELANAFGELTDPWEQRRRLNEDRELRRAAGLPVFDVDERFIAALAEGLPPTSGIALGVDRLLMLLLDAPTINHVVAFAPDAV